jgi:hypothetical protein
MKTTKNFEQGSTCLDRDSSEHLQDMSIDLPVCYLFSAVGDSVACFRNCTKDALRGT